MDSNLIENKLENECIDWISNMPDSILGKILSYVPTKDAVATSILSTSWKHLFPFGVPPIKLVLDDSELLHPRENESNNLSTSFIDFVDKLLNKTLCDEPCVDRLDLKCHKHCDDAKIVSWICAALRLKLRDLELEFSLNESMTLFHCLNGCTTLSSLELGKNFELCLPKNFTLPNLTRLLLISLTFHNEDSESINELISGCPKLEDLWLSGCNLQFLGVLYIRSSLLKGVVIENSWDDSECHLVLDAPNLEFLTYNDFCATSYRVSSFKSLFGAHIDVGPSDQQLEELDEDSDDEGLLVFDDHVAQIVKACSSTKHLYLAACSIAALQRSSIQLPVFQNLIALYLGCLGFHGWTLLPRLLWNTPNLETLKFEQGVGKSQGGIADFESLVTSPPICLELHLKEIEFWVFKGEEEEFKLIEYFLKNGKVLETIDIPIHPLADMSILGRLLLLRRHSKTCEFFFPGKKM